MRLRCSASRAWPQLPLPAWRRAQLARLHREEDRQRGALAYALLRELLLEGWGIEEEGPWGYGPQGKPYLIHHPQLHFNLSHCKQAAACVVAEYPVGIDVEDVPPHLDEELLAHVCKAEECRLILQSTHPARQFAQVWTQKESYLKWKGVGLIEQLDTVFEDSADPHILQSGFAHDFSYVWTICHAAGQGGGTNSGEAARLRAQSMRSASRLP